MPEINKLVLGKLFTNCFIVRTGNANAIVIDPAAEADRISRFLEHNNLKLEKILLTHGHFDHIEAAPILRERHGAPIYIGSADGEMTSDCEKASGNFLSDVQFNSFEADYFLSEGDSIEQDELLFTVMETPGHTRGSVCYFCDRDVFVGDTLFYMSVGRTDMYSGDSKAQQKSLRRLMLLEEDYTVYCGHGDETTLSYEKKHNPYIRWW